MLLNYIQKFVSIILLSFFCYSLCNAQRLTLDSAAISDWPFVSEEAIISNNGKYAGYYVQYRNKLKWETNFILWSSSTASETTYPAISRAIFTKDSKFCIGFNDISGQVMIRNLKNQSDERIDNTTGYQLVENNKEVRIIYSKKDNEHELIVHDPQSKKSIAINDVYSCESYGDCLMLVLNDDSGSWKVMLYDPIKQKKSFIWSGSAEVNNMVVQTERKVLAFISGGGIWYYNPKLSPIAQILHLPEQPELKALSLNGLDGFSKSGKLLLLQYCGSAYPDTLPDQNRVRIFDYRDVNFDLEGQFVPQRYSVVYHLDTGTFSFPENDQWILPSTFNPARFISPDDQYLIRKNRNAGVEYYWNKKQANEISILNVDQKKEITIKNTYYCSPSSTFDYIVFLDENDGNYYSLDTRADTIINLTSNLPIPATDNIYENLQGSRSRGLGAIICWIDKNSSFLISDRYDLWLLDAAGKQPAFNITNGYGRAHHITFRWPTTEEKYISLVKGQSVIFSTYDAGTKESGFAEIRWGKLADPKIITMDHYLYGNNPRESNIVKAAGVNTWLVRRQSPSESPNYFLTSDFKNFKPVSHNYPEKKYSWFSSKVINYTTNDGISSQAILYVPDHLEAGKKYPVLFNFYEHETDRAGSNFQMPKYTNSYYFNYAKMLSEGYLVCVCDIHFKLGETAYSIVDCVEGAADAVAGLPYVDSSRYGASGGSFGGYGVNCLAALSHRFKAIVSVSGIANLLNWYTNVPGLRDEEVENRQGRMGISLATDPKLYLKNSPVAYTGAITTPLLIIDNPKDGNINPQQGIDWFLNLRREGKRHGCLRIQMKATV